MINTDALSTLKDNTHFDTRAQLTLGKQVPDIVLLKIPTRKPDPSNGT